MTLPERLRQLSIAVAEQNWSEFSMRVPAEPDRDADIVLMQAAMTIESLRQQLADSQKQVVMLREAIEYHQTQTRPIQRTEEALAATDDLDGLILCDAVEVGWIGTGPRDRRCEFSESKPANSVMRDFNMKPLYRAWEPK